MSKPSDVVTIALAEIGYREKASNAYLDDKGTDLRISGSREYTAPAEEEADRIWFIDPYSKTFAMEDRARLMETLLQDSRDSSAQKSFSSPHIQAKLRY